MGKKKLILIDVETELCDIKHLKDRIDRIDRLHRLLSKLNLSYNTQSGVNHSQHEKEMISKVQSWIDNKQAAQQASEVSTSSKYVWIFTAIIALVAIISIIFAILTYFKD